LSTRIGSDGLRARENGQWAITKLRFLDRFGPPAIDATRRKRRRVFIDLFAGPGLNIDPRSGAEFPASSLRVLQMSGAQHPSLAFTDAVLVNLNRLDHGALETRVDRLVESGASRIPRDRLRVLRNDANGILDAVLAEYHRLDYLWVFADLEAPRQFPFSTVEVLRSRGHRSIDLYALFPLEMGILRLTSYQPRELDRYASILTPFFGTDEWRSIVERRMTSGFDRINTCRRDLEELYIQRLRRHWLHVDRVCEVRTVGRRGLYRMLFATDHEAGKNIAQWAKRHCAPDATQGDLGL
jgi:three-Cys-motif partner protein